MLLKNVQHFMSQCCLIPEPGKDTTRRENCTALSRVNMDAQILNKTPAD